MVEKLRAHGVVTILDAGCGTGKLMQKLIVEHGEEFDVHGFDISANCLDPFFDDIKDDVLKVGCLWDAEDFCEAYDAIVCTDVLEHVPTERVPAVLRNFRKCTQKMCYLAIALFPDGFGPALVGEPLHLTVKEPGWWFTALSEAGLGLESWMVERDSTGKDLWLHAILTVSQ